MRAIVVNLGEDYQSPSGISLTGEACWRDGNEKAVRTVGVRKTSAPPTKGLVGRVFVRPFVINQSTFGRPIGNHLQREWGDGMTVINRKKPGQGDWSAAANWSPGTVLTLGDAATISTSGLYCHDQQR